MVKTVLIFLAFVLFAGCGKKTEKKIPARLIQNSNHDNSRLPGFLFVGMNRNRPAIYDYNFKSGKSKLFWFKSNESVVDLSYSLDKRFAFFVTARSRGRNGASFYIKRVKVYLVNLKTSEISFITSMGNGIQVFTGWEIDNSFKIIINAFDIKVASYINQHTKIFNIYGKLLVDKTETYDFAKNGYPVPKGNDRYLSSAGTQYSIRVISDSGKSKIYFVDNTNNYESLIVNSEQKLNDVIWGDNQKYVFISTANSASAALFIYSTESKNILKSWTGSGVNNFLVFDDYLIFDFGRGKESSINIFDFSKMKLVKNINISGGCGINKVQEDL